MSLVTYNGVKLPYCHFTRLNQKAGFEKSNTDWTWIEFDIEVQCVVHSNYIPLLYPAFGSTGGPATTNPANVMRAVRQLLLRPRRALSVVFNGVELIPQPAQVPSDGFNPGVVDAQNGPTPIDCRITDLSNDTFLVIFQIRARYWQNDNVTTTPPTGFQNQMGSPVLFNRWTERVELDELQMSTRVREGTFGIRSDNNTLNTGGMIADQLRSQFAVTGVPGGFLRKSSDYQVSEDGLTLTYRIVDVEQFKMPPTLDKIPTALGLSPAAFHADGYYEETATNNGAIRKGECYVRLMGDKITSQDVLVKKCVAIVASKVRINGVFAILEAAVVRVDMYKNTVHCLMRVMFNPGDKAGAGQRFAGAAGLALMGNVPGVPMTFTPGTDGPNDLNQPNYLDRGTAGMGRINGAFVQSLGLLLQAAAYYDPSIPAASNPLNRAAGQMTKGLEVGQAGATLEP